MPSSRPAVSTTRTSWASGPRRTRAARASRVLPARASTRAGIARAAPRSSRALKRELLPAFGGPARTTRGAPASGAWRATSQRVASSRAWRAWSPSSTSCARGTCPVSFSSKSRDASRSARSSSIRSRSPTRRSSSPPMRSAVAARCSASPAAWTRERMPSARVRSRAPCSNARRVNSPAVAGRAPREWSLDRAASTRWGLPTRWSSATSSRVNDPGPGIQRSRAGCRPPPSSNSPVTTPRRGVPSDSPASSRNAFRTIASASGPDRRTTARAPAPGGLLRAQIVSRRSSSGAARSCARVTTQRLCLRFLLRDCCWRCSWACCSWSSWRRWRNLLGFRGFSESSMGQMRRMIVYSAMPNRLEVIM